MIYCLLCNEKLEFLDTGATEYGYLCAECKKAVLRVGKNQLDHLNQMADTMKELGELKALPLGAFNNDETFNHEHDGFASNLASAPARSQVVKEAYRAKLKREPITHQQSVQWTKQDDISADRWPGIDQRKGKPDESK